MWLNWNIEASSIFALAHLMGIDAHYSKFNQREFVVTEGAYSNRQNVKGYDLGSSNR